MSKHGRINHGSCKRGRGSSAGPLTLEELVSVQGGKTGYGLDFPYDTEHSSLKNPLNTNQDKDIDVQAAQKVNQKRYRIFERKSSRIQSANKSDCDDFQRNPYKGKQRSNILSIENHQMKELRTGNNISHIVCSISENIARETCIASMEASSPVTLMISKQCNGQSYAETLAYLRYLQPDEILLNEGRKSSNLSQKVIAEFNFQKQPDAYIARRSMTRSTVDRHFGRPKKKNRPRKDNQDERTLKEEDEKHLQDLENHAAIKFVPRYFFDQKKGAELLHRVARQGSYDPSILEEYIFLSSSNAVIQYIQTSLGAYFSTASIDLSIHSGQGNRMAIDRSTIIHLELLANAKTGKLANSLIGTIDCTKTSVGSRLLRNNLISPPIRLATIHARLDLVDTFLQDEEFFYEVLAQLEALPDLNKMLSHISLTPEKIDKSTAKIVVTPRMASKGISALVCIKTTLGVVFNLARILEIQLTSLKSGTSSRDDLADTPDDCSSLSSVSRLFDNQNELSLQSCSRQSPDDVRGKDALIVGLGGSAPGQEDETFSINRHQLLEAIIIALKNPALNEIMSFVADVFTESTSYCKNSHAMRHQECFALKPNTDGIMDIIRKAYLSNVDDIYRFADEYAEAFGTTVAVKETAARGYFLSIPNDARPLPSIFMQPVKNGKNIHCTTEDVYSLNTRAQENVQDLLLMTHERIQEVLNEARQRFNALASLSDAIALLDLCHSFADNVACDPFPWCRPTITDCSSPLVERVVTGVSSMNETKCSPCSGALVIKNGRYGIDTRSAAPLTHDSFGREATSSFIPNDTYVSAYQNFTVITGVNGSGKSTYLKQIAIIIILAHCGSYVPADEAFIPIRDKLFTRLGNTDDQEHNISSFLQEMKESSFICNNVTDKSLVLIDELGRATSNEDGVAIAWAIAEHLLVRRAFTFFVTHYPQLCKLSEIYPNVQNQHLGVLTTAQSNEISYTHKILPGPCRSAADYGITMCTMCGWDKNAVHEAEAIHREVGNKLPDGVICQSSNTTGSLQDNERKAETILWDLAKHLVSLKESLPSLTNDAMRSYLHDLHEKKVPHDDGDVVEMMRYLLLNEALD